MKDWLQAVPPSLYQLSTPTFTRYAQGDLHALIFNPLSTSYPDIFSYSKLKEQYGTVELDQMLFDLGIKTAWTMTALKELLVLNKELQSNLQNELNEASHL